MVLGNSANISSEVRALIDWISFTIFGLDTVQEVVEFLGYTLTDFTEMPKGAQGYKNLLRLTGHSISILYNGNEDMGIHVTITGSAVSDCLCHFQQTLVRESAFGDVAYSVSELDNSVMIEFLTRVRRIAKISRLDIAVDDIGGNFYSTDEVREIIKERKCVTKFRDYQLNEKGHISTLEKTGDTVYFGSRRSDVFLRVYDKQKEQNCKISASNNDTALIDYMWFRWELECKNERANRVADILITGQKIGFIIASVLNNYFRVIELDNNNRSRCSVSEKWISFLGTVSKIGLYVERVKRTLKDKRNWIIKQVLPTLTGVIIADGGSLDIIVDNMETSLNRMSNEMLSILSEYNRDWLSSVRAF